MSNLDKSLDDLINMSKKSEGGRARNSVGPGPSRRHHNLTSNRAAPYSIRQVVAPDTSNLQQHDMFAGRVSSIETGTKLLISNLDYGVTDEDIKELFGVVGEVKGYSIDYDKSGRSKGTGEVVFSRRRDAEEAVKRYNDVQLDGKHMKIEIVLGTNLPAAMLFHGNHQSTTAPTRNHVRPIDTRRHQNGVGRSMRGREGGRGRGRGNRKEKMSAEELDADLDNYYEKAAAQEILLEEDYNNINN
ncbi:THO complex subunit 4A-like [Impatiens glandulifera]|uniref:THO complex subunit 4A-like n=1 Tax=Impatiens glandulifera TaxID=253017 RepID=UPI001FB0C348|nr:THO complex subunit 4A-like [Impatiens glandulifera]